MGDGKIGSVLLLLNPKNPADLIAQRTRVKKSGIRLFEQVSGIH
jgi:hypothetical protein